MLCSPLLVPDSRRHSLRPLPFRFRSIETGPGSWYEGCQATTNVRIAELGDRCSPDVYLKKRCPVVCSSIGENILDFGLVFWNELVPVGNVKTFKKHTFLTSEHVRRGEEKKRFLLVVDVVFSGGRRPPSLLPFAAAALPTAGTRASQHGFARVFVLLSEPSSLF